ncbi:MAG: 4'-phosphopantetheinyl transferase family protein [Terriglobales bacterium]
MASVAVFWFALQADAPQRRAWLGWLAPHERARVERYLRPEHGERYLAAHAHLRWLLARELGCAPAEVRFTRAPHGKPELEGGGLQFNLSHSARLGLAAIAPGGGAELGVDIEAERPRNFLALARRFFTPAEQAWLAAQPAAQLSHGFVRLWTCKEAWMKADGRGLAVLRQPEVSFHTGGTQLRALGRAWWLRELDLAPGYGAAVVLAQAPESLSVNWLPPPPP